jgi:uncharacterized protein
MTLDRARGLFKMPHPVYGGCHGAERLNMAVRCPGCGREYDVTLFEMGRTIECTCGRVVGLQHRVVLPAGRPPRFLVDAMLGRLARWLRVLGCDTRYEAAAEDDDLVRESLAEGRILLTRDRGIPRRWWVDNCFVVAGDDPMVQLREVVKHFGLDPRRRLFTRCTLCNTPLQILDAEETVRHVPAALRDRHERFVRCPSCGRLYWEGSHVDRMRRRLEEALTEEERG